MFKLVQRYASRDAEEWKPLFYKILHNRIRDWHRRNRVRQRFRVLLGSRQDDSEHTDPIQNAPDPPGRTPESEARTQQAMAELDRTLADLPPRQQQAFLLRAWEGLDVAQTATAMGCSQGSVKTHYHRAIQTLRRRLGDHWP